MRVLPIVAGIALVVFALGCDASRPPKPEQREHTLRYKDFRDSLESIAKQRDIESRVHEARTMMSRSAREKWESERDVLRRELDDWKEALDRSEANGETNGDLMREWEWKQRQWCLEYAVDGEARSKARAAEAQKYLDKNTTPKQEHEKAIAALLVDGWKMGQRLSSEKTLPASDIYDFEVSLIFVRYRDSEQK